MGLFLMKLIMGMGSLGFFFLALGPSPIKLFFNPFLTGLGEKRQEFSERDATLPFNVVCIKMDDGKDDSRFQSSFKITLFSEKLRR